MKWTSHQATALSAWHAFGMKAELLPFILAGAVLPDMIDHIYAGKGINKQKRFNKVHRKASHFWLFYVVIFFLGGLFEFYPEIGEEFISLLQELGILAKNIGAYSKELGVSAIKALSLGAIIHILGDMLTIQGVPYIPSHNWNKRIALKLFATGSMKEYLFVAGLVIFVYLLSEFL